MHVLGGWSEMAFAEGPAGAGLEVGFEVVGFLLICEPEFCNEHPGAAFGLEDVDVHEVAPVIKARRRLSLWSGFRRRTSCHGGTSRRGIQLRLNVNESGLSRRSSQTSREVCERSWMEIVLRYHCLPSMLVNRVHYRGLGFGKQTTNQRGASNVERRQDREWWMRIQWVECGVGKDGPVYCVNLLSAAEAC